VGYAREERLRGRRRRCAAQLSPSSSVVLWFRGGSTRGGCSRTAILQLTNAAGGADARKYHFRPAQKFFPIFLKVGASFVTVCLTARSRLQSRERLAFAPGSCHGEGSRSGRRVASWTGLSAPLGLFLPRQRPRRFHLLLRGAWVPATCPSPRKASLFILSKSSNPPKRGRGGGGYPLRLNCI